MLLATIGILDLALLSAATDPAAGTGWEQLSQLGVIALAVITGAGLVYRYVVLPDRKRAEAAAEVERKRTEAAEERERLRADREREDRQKAEERERELAKVAFPALQESSRALDTVLRTLDTPRRST